VKHAEPDARESEDQTSDQFEHTHLLARRMNVYEHRGGLRPERRTRSNLTTDVALLIREPDAEICSFGEECRLRHEATCHVRCLFARSFYDVVGRA
jgi:hypothetical protein